MCSSSNFLYSTVRIPIFYELKKRVTTHEFTFWWAQQRTSELTLCRDATRTSLNTINKISSAVAEIGDRFGHNRHGPKSEGLCPFPWEAGPYLTQCLLGRTKWHLDPPNQRYRENRQDKGPVIGRTVIFTPLTISMKNLLVNLLLQFKSAVTNVTVYS